MSSSWGLRRGPRPERWVHRRIALVVQTSAPAPAAGARFMAASAFLSMWINNTDDAPDATGRGRRPRPRGRGGRAGGGPRFAWCLPGVAYLVVGGMGTPVGTAPNQVFLGQFADRSPGPQVHLRRVVGLLRAAPAAVRAARLGADARRLPVLGSALRRRCRGRRGGTRGARTDDDPERRMAAVFAATALLWVFRADVRLGLVVPRWSRLLLDPSADAACTPSTRTTSATQRSRSSWRCCCSCCRRAHGRRWRPLEEAAVI